jgi:Flp pilus assembly pilin Flp
MTSLSRFKLSRRGVTGVEYGALLLVVGLAIFPLLRAGASLSNIFGGIGSAFAPAAQAAAPLPGLPVEPTGTSCLDEPVANQFFSTTATSGTESESQMWWRICGSSDGTLYSAALITTGQNGSGVPVFMSQVYAGQGLTVSGSQSNGYSVYYNGRSINGFGGIEFENNGGTRDVFETDSGAAESGQTLAQIAASESYPGVTGSYAGQTCSVTTLSNMNSSADSIFGVNASAIPTSEYPYDAAPADGGVITCLPTS